MIVPGSCFMPFWTCYPHPIAHSLILQETPDSYLSRAITGAGGNQKKFTISFWIKRSALGVQSCLVYYYINAGERSLFAFYPDNKLGIYTLTASGFTVQTNLITTAAVMVDTTIHHHVVLGIDTTQAVETDRITLEIDGVEIELTLGSGGTGKYPILNSNTPAVSANGSTNYIGNSYNWTVPTIGDTAAGKYSEVIFVDGQKLPASVFAGNACGNWAPKEYTGVYGAYGFHLKFDSVGSIGLDSSGNGNTFTFTGGSLPDDQSIDTPTNPV